MGPPSKKRSKDDDKPRREHKKDSSSGRREKTDKYQERNERKRKRNDDTSGDHEAQESSPSKKYRNKDEPEAGEHGSGSGGGDISLSIEETNKLREKLGLAPLQVDDKPKSKEILGEDGKTTTENVYTVDGVEFVHKAADNWADKKLSETLREKLHTQKEKRKIQEKISNIKSLGEADEGEDSAAYWVEKSRKIEQEKLLAQQRAKLLDEMDKDFGVGEIIDDQIKKKSASRYSSKDLRGMTVQHAAEHFAEGHETVLVLQDKDVLDESEEVLINPTLVDEEKWKKNIELRKRKPDYDPFDEQYDQFGNLKVKNLLGKYDEEIEGEKKESFKLDSRGSVDIAYDKLVAERMKAKLREGMESLEMKPSQIAAEYYTNEEMSKFKKPKKKVKKLRQGGALKADDLVSSADIATEDYGSRLRGKGRKKAQHEEKMDIVDDNEDNIDSQLAKLKENTSDDLIMPDDDLSNFVVEDEAESEFHSILHRTRLIKQVEEKVAPKQFSALADKIAGMVNERKVKEEPNGEDVPEEDGKGSAVVMNTISEYCRGLGDIPTYGLAGNRDDVDPSDIYMNDDMDDDSSQMASLDDSPRKPKSGKWIEAEFDEQDRLSTVSSSDTSEDYDSRPPILEDEPEASSGVAAALKLARQKGYLDHGDDGDHGPSKLAHLEAQRFTIVDKQFHDIDDKYAKKLERMGGYGGPVQDFKEKNTYQPNIKLEYADEKGNLLSSKDAFRYMSWKFHGKVPGKRKVEKRSKKIQEKKLMNQMSSTDTPLGTLGKQIEKQKQLQLPYIVLSGTGSKDAGASIKKE